VVKLEKNYESYLFTEAIESYW